MPPSKPPSAMQPRRWRVVGAVVALLAFTASGLFVAFRPGLGGSGSASVSPDAAAMSVSPDAPPPTTVLPTITDFVTPDAPSAVGVRTMTFTDLTRTT
ncbi:MAG: hypothetical protein F2674_02405, partial [Actinobacteria bacterium]|nr:hypothetical protein [Actinomycetota bacterium]